MDVTIDGLRDYAAQVNIVWTEWADEDVIQLANAAVNALGALADRLEGASLENEL